ncbi:MAG: tRNA (N(6)-L-threonylcarbamoyladenosine(37)-C(2))-methylthiotransferase MtaB [Bacillota bacterium]|nr:tRNA (N(6)-L-threonylcarbamoyladenosine(37)-C(2))-methylthiotransferase MtaB [Bacillota bacterium]
MKVAFYTLGCKVNQAEAGALQKLFLERGHTLVPFSENADLYVITTCTVTSSSDKKCRQTIRRIRRERSDAVVAVCGCFAQTNPEDAKALGADIICGVTDRKSLLELAENYKKDDGTKTLIRDVTDFRTFEPLFSDSNQGRTRALLKIQDGCDNFCSYCIIPYARGRSRSMLPGDAVNEAIRLKSEGFKEIVITGIEISSYGKDLAEKTTLGSLVGRILDEVPGVRIRLGSLDPGTVDRDFCCALQGFSNLCPHFHLSLQSGNSKILARMGRKYTADDYKEAVRLLYESFPGCAVTADLIVGFPGETPEDFSESLELIRSCSLYMVHVFPYSKRSGTRAARFENQVPRTERERRAHEAIKLADALKAEYLNRQIGTVAEVLFESEDQGFFMGHTKNYCPVLASSGESLKNTLRQVKIESTDGEYLYGEFVGSPQDTAL